MKEERLNVLLSARAEVPPGLLARILRRVELEKARYGVRRSLVAWSLVAGVATAGLAVAGTFFFKEAATSGLAEYLGQFWALVTVNPGLVLAHWSEILTSIGESLPVDSLVIAAAAIGLVLWSAEKVVGFSKKWRMA